MPSAKAALLSLAALAILAQAPVVACTRVQPPPAKYTLRVLASSELTDMGQILAQAAAHTGVTVRLTTTGTLTAAQQVKDGTAQQHYQAVWFASDNYISLFASAANELSGTTPIMSSPVILAVRTSVAQRLGWENGWRESGADECHPRRKARQIPHQRRGHLPAVQLRAGQAGRLHYPGKRFRSGACRNSRFSRGTGW